MIFQELPTVQQVSDHPELASLAMLDTALEIATTAIAAEQPGVGAIDGTLDLDASVTPAHAVAEAILHHAEALEELLACYCRLTVEPLRTTAGRPALVARSDDEPF